MPSRTVRALPAGLPYEAMCLCRIELSDDIRGERLRFVEAMKEATAINVQSMISNCPPSRPLNSRLKNSTRRRVQERANARSFDFHTRSWPSAAGAATTRATNRRSVCVLFEAETDNVGESSYYDLSNETSGRKLCSVRRERKERPFRSPGRRSRLLLERNGSDNHLRAAEHYRPHLLIRNEGSSRILARTKQSNLLTILFVTCNTIKCFIQ